MESTIVERLKAGKFVLIAEIGVNYYDIAEEKGISEMDAAKLMIKEAKEAGIHAVKFQTYKAGSLAAKDSPSYWDRTEEPTASQYELFKKFDSFGEKEYRELKEYADELGIEFLSTAFDFESADYLFELMNVYKISSSDLSNIPFIEYQAKKGKPMLLSIGASDLPEIEKAVDTIRSVNDSELVLLHCVLEYPTPLEHANLKKIQTLKQQFPDCYIGYSDHTKPTEEFDVVKVAYNMGAQLIEKHFTLDKTLSGNDHYHAMDPDDARQILKAVERMDMITGQGELSALPSEAAARENARRSIVAAARIDAGDLITRNLLTFKRPGTGISPSELGLVVGRTAACGIPEDTVLQPEMINNFPTGEDGEDEA